MRKLIAATALGTVLACCSPAFAQGVDFCDPRHSLKTWVESAPSGVRIHQLSRAGTEAMMEVEEPTSPLFANTVGAVLIVHEGSPVGVVAFYDDRGCIVDTLHANATDILLWIEDASGQAS